MPDAKRIAVVDEDMLRVIRPLVERPIEGLSILPAAERFFRAYVLYDSVEFVRAMRIYHHVEEYDWNEHDREHSGIADTYGIEAVEWKHLTPRREQAFRDVSPEEIIRSDLHEDIPGAISDYIRDSDVEGYLVHENYDRLEEYVANLIGVVRFGGGLATRESLSGTRLRAWVIIRRSCSRPWIAAGGSTLSGSRLEMSG